MLTWGLICCLLHIVIRGLRWYRVSDVCAIGVYSVVFADLPDPSTPDCVSMLKDVARTYEKEIQSRTGSVGRLFPGLHYDLQWMAIAVALALIWFSGANHWFMLVPLAAWFGSWWYFHLRAWRWLQARCSRFRSHSDQTKRAGESGKSARVDDREVMYIDFKLPPGLKLPNRTEPDDPKKLAADVIIAGFRKLAAHNQCAPTSDTSDEKIIEIYSKVTGAFNDAAKKRGELIRAVYLNGIVMKFLQIYEWRFKKDDKPPLDEQTAEKFLWDHLQYEIDKFLAEGLRPDYRRELPLI